MATWSAIELEVLQKALDAYPKGIGGNEYGTTVPEYKALHRLYETGLLDSRTEPQRYMNCHITEEGRDVLERAGSSETLQLDARQARTIIIVLIGNIGSRSNELGLKFSPQDAERAKAKVEEATQKHHSQAVHRMAAEGAFRQVRGNPFPLAWAFLTAALPSAQSHRSGAVRR